MNLQQAPQGKVKTISQPIRVFRAVEDRGDNFEEVRARFRWVPPRIEFLCRALAEYFLRWTLNREPSEDLINDEQHLLMVSYALRIDDGEFKTQVFPFPHVMGADGVTLLPKDEALVVAIRDCAVHVRCPQGPDLWQDYKVFLRTEFPTVVSDKEMDELLEDAKKKSLMTLVSERGFWKVVRLARGLAVAMHGSVTGTGNAG